MRVHGLIDPSFSAPSNIPLHGCHSVPVRLLKDHSVASIGGPGIYKFYISGISGYVLCLLSLVLEGV